MSHKKALSALAAAVAMAAGNASAVDFHGYFRAGFGINTDGGSQVCYGNGGPLGHVVGRLGDECDTYAELTLSQTVYEKNNESFSIHTMLALGTPGNNNRDSNLNYRGNAWQGVSDDNGNPWTGQRFSFREAYAKYKMQSGTEIWAGNRYYGRKDAHLWDLYYLNGSGYGAGVDNINAGPGKIAIAVRETKWHTGGVAEDANQPYVSTPQLDLRYNAIQLGAVGNLDLIALFGKPNYSDAQKAGQVDGTDYSSKAGVSLTAELSTAVLSGFNKVVLQYSTNGYGFSGYGVQNHLGDGYNASAPGDVQDDRKSFRIIDHGVIKLGKQLHLGYGVLYSQLDNPGSDKKGKRFSVAVRPQFVWNDTMSTMVELGYYNQEDPWEADAADLNKITLAQAWSPLMNGGFWARPQIRVFATFYGGDRAMDQSKTMVGAQVEAWW